MRVNTRDRVWNEISLSLLCFLLCCWITYVWHIWIILQIRIYDRHTYTSILMIPVLCFRHLQENVRQFLWDKVGAPEQQRNSIDALLLVAKGVVHQKVKYNFEDMVMKLTSTLERKIPAFTPYIDKIISSIRQYMFMPYLLKSGCHLTGRTTPVMWINESHLEMQCELETTRVPDLCDKLHDIINCNIWTCIEPYMDQAITNSLRMCHVGNLRVNHIIWHSMTESEKDAFFQKLLLGKSIKCMFCNIHKWETKNIQNPTILKKNQGSANSCEALYPLLEKKMKL